MSPISPTTSAVTLYAWVPQRFTRYCRPFDPDAIHVSVIHPSFGWRRFAFLVNSTALSVDRDMRRPPNLLKTVMVPEPVSEPAAPGPPANYLDFYGLSKPPFGAASGGAGTILFSSHRRAFELLTEHVTNGTGLLLLQGEEGIGKTEMLRAVAAEPGVRTIMVSRPANGRLDLVQLVAALQGQPSANAEAAGDAIAHVLTPPRKVLLADDVDLMPAECVRLLLSLVQRIPNDQHGPAIVLAGSGIPAADPKRPELTQLIGLARDTVRLTRLGSAEIGQYIERSLWIAGGTTRRLITSDAIKVLVTRSGGLPGTANRVIEAALNAGFARGDAMITTRTVAAAMGPVASRPRYREPAPPGRAGRAMQVAGAGLLLLGASAFLYRGLTGATDRAVPRPAVSTAPRVQPVVPQPLPGAKAAENLPPDLVTALMKRGDQSLDWGDIAGARLLYQRAAEAGNAAAATALGKTYDPNFTASGGAPDQARAAEWYRKAAALGDTHAADLQKRLGSR